MSSKVNGNESSDRDLSSQRTEGDSSEEEESSNPPPPPPSSTPPPMVSPLLSVQTNFNSSLNTDSSSYAHSPLYLSSASSSTHTNRAPTTSTTLPMTTIENNNSSITKKHDFLVPYDSDDASDASLLLIQKQQQAQQTNIDTSRAQRRDRFPSFDSLASSGSVVRYVSPKRQQEASPAPQQHQPQQQQLPVNPQLLPYHERKKLQQRQQQNRPPQQQQQMHPPYPQHHMMMMMQPQPLMDPQAAAAFRQMFGGFHQLPPNQQHPGFPPQGYPPPPQGFMMPPPNYQQQQHLQQQQQHAPFMQPYPIPFYPPQGTAQHQQSPNISPRPNPFPHPKQQQEPPRKETIDRTRLSANSATNNRPKHDRDASTGSMSSLGSFDPDDKKRHVPKRSSGSGNFFTGMLPSPKTTSPNINDFHRTNQEFLKKNHHPQNSPSNNPFEAEVQPPTHRRVGSEDRPPASRGTHKRLTSITDDDWMETSEDEQINTTSNNAPGIIVRTNSSGGEGSSVSYSSSDMTGDERDYQEANERTSLLPPPGISTNERGDANRTNSSRHHRKRRKKKSSRNSSRSTQSYDSHGQSQSGMHASSSSQRSSSENFLDPYNSKKSRKVRKKKSKSRRKSSHRHQNIDPLGEDTSDSSYKYDSRGWSMKRARMLEKERAKALHEEWKAEYMAKTRKEQEEQWWYRRFARFIKSMMTKVYRFFISLEMFIANLPLAIGAVAMSVVTLGVVWFKFTEENLESCERVHFHSSQCTFPEFPGCFYCDTSNPLYKLALNFHYGCNITAGFLAFLFIAKVLMATRVVVDEMASPVTASPAGLLCMTTVCVFAGHGLIGQVMVSLASSVHLGLVIWYIYMALAYQIMPEPTWFPNTIGVGLSAVKTWLYYPMPGHLLMAISLSLNIFFFPISLIRVVINEKISATVGWMQMSAPAISLYALTIMAQPSFVEENPDVTNFQRMHRVVYLPCMHFMCALSIVGFIASCHSLWTRWDDFKKRPFSPAHSAFCFPTLSHANAIQSYRGAVLTFGDIQPHDWRLIVLYVYWFVILAGGTIATFWISAKFLYRLPQWTNLDLADEEEPPAPSETILSLQEMITTGDSMKQHFVSPAILQANETGALVLTRSGPGGTLKYVRTRRLPALGFEPTMNWSEMQQERDLLLEHVVKHPPRRRHRTLSVPGIDFGYGSSLGTDNSGVYSPYGNYSPLPARRTRADSGW